MAERRDEKELLRRLVRDARRREAISHLGGPFLGILFSIVLLGTAAIPEGRPATLREAVVRVAFPGFRLLPVRASID